MFTPPRLPLSPTSPSAWLPAAWADSSDMDIGYEAALPFLSSQPGELDAWPADTPSAAAAD